MKPGFGGGGGSGARSRQRRRRGSAGAKAQTNSGRAAKFSFSALAASQGNSASQLLSAGPAPFCPRAFFVGVGSGWAAQHAPTATTCLEAELRKARLQASKKSRRLRSKRRDVTFAGAARVRTCAKTWMRSPAGAEKKLARTWRARWQPAWRRRGVSPRTRRRSARVQRPACCKGSSEPRAWRRAEEARTAGEHTPGSFQTFKQTDAERQPLWPLFPFFDWLGGSRRQGAQEGASLQGGQEHSRQSLASEAGRDPTASGLVGQP